VSVGATSVQRLDSGDATVASQCSFRVLWCRLLTWRPAARGRAQHQSSGIICKLIVIMRFSNESRKRAALRLSCGQHLEHSDFDAHARMPRLGRQAVERNGTPVVESLEHSGVDVGLTRDGRRIAECGGNGA
jgi:hypothetical protein